MDNVTDADFATNVLEASKSKPVLIKFTAPWCGPCHTLAPILEGIASEHSDKITIYNLDTVDILRPVNEADSN